MQMRSSSWLYRISYLLFFTLSFSSVFAQTIKGKVYDDKTGEPLIGANVTIENTPYKTVVKLDGSFALRVPEAGTYHIVVSTVGYLSGKGITVDVKSGNETFVNIPMQSSATVMQEAYVSTVTGPGTDREARRIEQRADMVQNILSARTIEISPDVTVANALQRVSGVVIQRDNTGEGRYAIIRGMDQRYNNTLVNGIKIPSPDDKFRFVPMDIFPSDMVERIEVIKALTPNMEGDAIGGTMNLVMKSAPDHLVLAANAAGGYNTIFGDQKFSSFSHSGINKKSPAELHGNNYAANPYSDFTTNNFNYSYKRPVNTQLGLTVGNRFLDKKLGVIVSASYQDFYKGSTSDRLVPDAQPYPQPSPNTPSFSDAYVRQYSTQTQRMGLQGKIDYVFNARNRISLFNMYLHQTDNEVRYTPDTTVGLNSSPGQQQLSVENRSTWQIQDIYNTTLQGTHELSSKVKVDWSGVYSIAKKELPDQSWYSFDATVSKTNGKITSIDSTIKQDKGLISALWQHNKDQDLAGYGNISYKPTLFHREVEFTTGGLYRYKTRNNYYNKYDLQSDTAGNFHTIGAVPRYFTPADYATGNITAVNANTYTAHEKIAAGYIQAKFMLLKALQVLGGVRVENTQQDYTTVMPSTFTGAYGNIHYTDVLPSVHLKYLLSGNQNLRLSYFKSISRPGFGEVVPYDLPTGEQFEEIGNPYLKHVRADNLDLRYELFPGIADQILLGTFYKQLQNPIEYFVVRDASPSALYIKPQNANRATNFGAEAVVTKYFGKFGVSANYTYTHSRITTPKVVYEFVQHGTQSTDSTYSTTQSRPLQGQADHVGNLSLLYKDPVFGLDVQLAFSYIGNRIVQVSQYYNLDIWQKPIEQLDLSFEKRIVRRLSFYAKISNLTNSKPKQYIKVPYKVVNGNFNNYAIPFQDARSSYTTVQRDIYKLNFLAGFRYKF
ncbi:MAG TPA: TonB-dependent receptor [Puia sp.]|nr:TonB-dependent receptor [Puia sp.]